MHRGGETKIEVWKDNFEVYKHQINQNNAEITLLVMTMFELFEKFLSKEQHE